MKINYNIKKVVIIFIAYVAYVSFFKGYKSYFPTIPIYPNNEGDLNVLKGEISKRTQEDIDFFYKTNVSVVSAFLPYVNEKKEELDKIVTSQNYIIYFFKYLINRRRPYQLNKKIIPLNTDTSQTPAYPAGHAYQATLLAHYLSKKYPGKKNLFDMLALKCDDCRVKAGIHYKSDGVFSRKLFHLFN